MNHPFWWKILVWHPRGIRNRDLECFLVLAVLVPGDQFMDARRCLDMIPLVGGRVVLPFTPSSRLSRPQGGAQGWSLEFFDRTGQAEIRLPSGTWPGRAHAEQTNCSRSDGWCLHGLLHARRVASCKRCSHF